MPNKLEAKTVQELVTKIVKLLDDTATVEVEITDSVKINIDSENSGALIGRMGQNLSALQYLVRLMVNKLNGEQTPLVLDIANYKSNKSSELKELALSVAENVKNSGYPQTLRPMNSYERRLIHSALAGFDGIESVSIGEEPTRQVEIKPKGK